MALSHTQQLQQLIDATSALDLPPDPVIFDSRVQFESVCRDVRKLEGIIVVLNHLPPVDPDTHLILKEAMALHCSVRKQLSGRIHNG